MTMNIVERYAEQGFELKVDETKKIATCKRESKRARLGYKIEFNFIFLSVERMYQYLENYINDHIKAQEAKAKRKEEQKARAAELANQVKVGDVFVDSWGYEQTNVDFYEVVAKPTAKTIVVREIAARTVDGTEGYMCCEVRPVPGKYLGEERKVRLNAWGHFKTSSFSSASRTEANKSHYKSWYY